MAGGKRFRPPLIKKVIYECLSSGLPRSRWQPVCDYIKERQPEEYERALEAIKKEFPKL
jgi:hypothetical protein